jgi:hypothetical protein
LILIGLKDLIGAKCHDYPRIDHIYKGYQDISSLYGRGFSYTRLIDDDKRMENNDSMDDDIRNHKYDKIIYSSYLRGIPFWDKVNEYYSKEDIILMDGEDDHYDFFIPHPTDSIFVRELP